MNISISNIAWDKPEDADVARVLQEFHIPGIDVAPSKIWERPLEVSDKEIADYIAWWKERGIQIVGAQSLHFGFPELQMFTTPTARKALYEHTARMIELCGRLGVSAIVFGSPKNRVRGEMELEMAMDIATDFFKELGHVAQDNNTHLCIEPNAAAYGCDFINTAAEGLALVQRVNHPGIRLHLDSGNMTMMKEDCVAAIEQSVDWMQHFHVSEPQMTQVGVNQSPVPHAAIADALRRVGYKNWVSIEMKNGLQENNVTAVKQALQFVGSVYL